VSRLSRQCGILNISQPYRPSRPATGKLVFLLYFAWRWNEQPFLKSVGSGVSQSLQVPFTFSLSFAKKKKTRARTRTRAHTHTHTHTYIYIYIHISLCPLAWWWSTSTYLANMSPHWGLVKGRSVTSCLLTFQTLAAERVSTFCFASCEVLLGPAQNFKSLASNRQSLMITASILGVCRYVHYAQFCCLVKLN
jgi:hypothetical protein